MSFITKRERVFNEYDLFDLPARNEGKLKAYASCTDARAWSHFCSDKSEHLVDLIRRNNETVRPKYLPTDVIVDTLMVAKNAEIARLKRKIEEFEQMLTAYDQLELSCDQKCEIAHAHAAIKAANKELDELFIDLDLSGYTEVLDSEAFATGKSRGDEEPSPNKYSQGVQNDDTYTCEVATLAKDPRITEMQDIIITKDAKLNAMKNTIAVMENDVCEPYCIYAHIYTALEKIFGILCQNDKYRQYLKLLTAGKDIRCIDIKGKILFKLKVLEKFCCALITPCTQDLFAYSTQLSDDCACYRVDVTESRIQPTYALTSAESKQPSLDNKRAKLVADIIQNDEMKEILYKEDPSVLPDEDLKDEVVIIDHNYNIDKENLKRIKSLQDNYDELISCYETLKHEKDTLEKRCNQYEEMEKEYESMKVQMHEYNSLWNEKEHFRKRSIDLDSLKEQYLILTDETTNLETELKAEGEINNMKSKAIDSLRFENISLEKKINEASIDFEKEKNALLCKLKEADCRIMCQDQQIKSLLQQIDNLLEHDHEKDYSREPATNSLALLDEIESSKEEIQNLRNALLCNEEEKQDIQKHYQHHLELINELKLEIEDSKSTYEKALQHNAYLENYNKILIEEARQLNQDVDEKSIAADNLMSIIKNKSQEINKLMQDIEKERDQNINLYKQVNELRERFENEKLEALQSLQVARQESQELLDKVKDYDQIIHKKADVTKSLEQQLQDNKELQDLLKTTIEENRKLKNDSDVRENNNSLLVQEIKRLHDENEYIVEAMRSLEDQNKRHETSLDLIQKENGGLKDKIKDYENLTLQLQTLQDSHNKLFEEKSCLENELIDKSYELENTIQTIQLSKRESEEIIERLQQSEGSTHSELSRIREAHQTLYGEKNAIEKALMEKKRDLDNLLHTLNNLKLENEELVQKCTRADGLEQEFESLKKDYVELSKEKKILEANKSEELDHLCNTLDIKIEENRELMEHIKSLETEQSKAANAIQTLRGEKTMTQSRLNVIKKESAELVDKIKYYEVIETEYENLKRELDQMSCEKQNLQTELNRQLSDLRRMEKENLELHSHSQTIIAHSEDLECALLDARKEVIIKSSLTSESFKNIMDEIEVMRQEKRQNQLKIRDLYDQLDVSENMISGLRDDVLARDSKIANLQNHINELGEEVSRLHSSLEAVISAGEQMKDFSIQKIDTLQNIEAHHSRATHNMKIELAKLQKENFMLSEQLSVTKIKSEESSRNMYLEYATHMKHLQNEREIIVTDIKQLELESVGDTALIPNNCTVEDILASLDRIRDSFKARSTKSSSLEQTLLKVQTSSQLLLSKADEAKKIVEREKQKIISEKEDAIIDKQNMEKKLFELKAKLEKQIANDKSVIEDLEASILNHKLISDSINKSTQDYISKLEEELKTLKDLYNNSVESIGELQERLQSMTEDRNDQSVRLEEIKTDLGKKSKEVAELQKQLELLKKPRNVEAQAEIMDVSQNMGSQTDTEKLSVEINKMQTTESSATMTEEKNVASANMVELNKLPLALDKRSSQTERNSKTLLLGNEVQILSAAVDQPFNVLRSSYVDYKMKLLSTGRLEQHSINSFTDREKIENIATTSSPAKNPRELGKKSANGKGNNLIDIYNRQSQDTTSSKGNDESENITGGKFGSQSKKKTTGYIPTRESFEKDSNNIISKYRDSKTYEGSLSGKSTDRDLFVIYKDSNSSCNNNKELSKGAWSDKGHPDIVIEAVTIHPTKKGISADIIRPRSNIKKDSFNFQENEQNSEEASVQHKLKINLPRIITESASVDTTSDVDKKSFDSYSLALYSSLNQFSDSDTKFNEGLDVKNIMVSLPTISDEDKQYLESYNSLRGGSDENARPIITMTNEEAFEMESDISKQKHTQIPMKIATISTTSGNESHHKLSRVGADVLLLKAEQDQKVPQIGMRQNFGLEYIMDTVQGEVQPDVEKYYTAKDLRKTRSDEIYDLIKVRDRADSSPSKLSEFKISSTEYKTISSNSKSSDKTPQKSYTERSIMAKLDVNNDYEIQINTLTRALENIEKDYKKKIEAIKMQYDSNIKSIINEHNQGVKSIQSLHEETLQDLMKLHESEVENLRTMSMEAMRKADKLEKENRALKMKAQDSRAIGLDEEPIKMTSPEIQKRRKCRVDTRMLTTTTVEAINVKPRTRLNGPCTCSLDVNISDTIRNIFEQVDVEQRKMAEHTYLKYIANKILNVEGPGKHDALQTLDTQELSFLHLKVCRTWKTKLTKEEALQRRIDSLEYELMNKQRNAQQHITELDRKVVEERLRLQEVLEAVCRRTPSSSRAPSPDSNKHFAPPPASNAKAERDPCGCIALNIGENRRPSAELAPKMSSGSGQRAPARRPRPESHRVTLGRAEVEDRRDRRPTFTDEPPTRLRRSHDRHPPPRFANKK